MKDFWLLGVVVSYSLSLDEKENKVAICKECNIQNEYMDFDSNYVCYKCKNNL